MQALWGRPLAVCTRLLYSIVRSREAAMNAWLVDHDDQLYEAELQQAEAMWELRDCVIKEHEGCVPLAVAAYAETGSTPGFADAWSLGRPQALAVHLQYLFSMGCNAFSLSIRPTGCCVISRALEVAVLHNFMHSISFESIVPTSGSVSVVGRDGYLHLLVHD